jgi:HD superfamily phosphohydrolase/tRNA A-37 threonylcarbamoyl transferase component Bud32
MYLNIKYYLRKIIVSDKNTVRKYIDNIRTVYQRKGIENEFADEEQVYVELLTRLPKELKSKSYELTINCIGIGSTASIWIVNETDLKQKRVLKITRPRLGRLKDIIKVIQGERDRLATLNHENIVKIYAVGEVTGIVIKNDRYDFPYFIMDYLKDVKDLDDYLKSNQLTLDKISEIFQGVFAGTSYLHEVGIVHCDLKPENILIAPNHPPLVTDFGYSKHLPSIPSGTENTDVTYTKKYAHPELIEAIIYSTDPKATRSVINKEKLRPAFDLYSLGITLREVLLYYLENSNEIVDDHIEFDKYQVLYISLISKRLLDGVVNTVDGNELLTDHIPGLPNTICKEIAYRKAEEALEDIQKLLNLYNIEGEIPELNSHIQNYIQIPGSKVPLTSRVKSIISHESFLRLANVTQLGFVSLLYPGAKHTRYEHVLGSFTRCCEYIKSLWYDKTSPVFKSLMTKKDLELAILSALLHDIAQYPMAHDLTEVSSLFEHEIYTDTILQLEVGDGIPPLIEIIKFFWNVTSDEILDVLKKKESESFKIRIIRSLINGPLDCDKVDYTKRDSIHLGVPFGNGFDEDRLIRNLTLAYRKKHDDETNKDIIETLGIGVNEKALAAASGLWKVRREMFTQIYWHHTIRALKSMLGYIVRQTMLKLKEDENIEQQFWEDFLEILCGSKNKKYRDCETEKLSDDDYVDFLHESDNNHIISELDIGDQAVLYLFEKYAPTSAKIVINKILKRELFVRHTVISKNREEQIFEGIYSRYRTFRLEGNISQLEEMRKNWENEIKNKIKENLQKKNNTGPIDFIENCDPLIIVDVPLKSTSRNERDVDILYLPEEHNQKGKISKIMFPKYSATQTILGEKDFDEQVGKIRVFVDSKARSIMEQSIEQNEVRKILYEK